MMTLLHLMVLSVALIGMQSTPVEGLINTVAVVGSEVNFTCPSDSGNCDGVDWHKYDGSNQIRIARDNGVYTNVDRDRYSVTGSSGCQLRIKNVQLTDAGRLSCTYIDSKNRQIPKHAFLILLEFLPRCSVNATDGDVAEGDGVQLTCEMKYNGTYRASLTWKDLKNVSTSVQSGRNVKFSHSVIAKHPEIPSHECIATFELPELPLVTGGIASNIPTAPPCKTNVTALLYSVRNVTLSPSLPVYSVGSSVICSSDGNPPPSYKWQISDAFINITDGDWKDFGEPGETKNEFHVKNLSNSTFRCIASNTVRGISYTEFSQLFQVNYAADPDKEYVNDPNSSSIIIFAAGGAAGIVGLLIIVIIICLCKRNCNKEQTTKSEKDKLSNGDQLSLTQTQNTIINGSHDPTIPIASVRPQPEAHKRPKLPPPEAAPPQKNVPKKKHPDIPPPKDEGLVYASLASDQDPRRFQPQQFEVSNSEYAAVALA